MTHNLLQHRELKLNILAQFYLFLALFHLLSRFMFSTNVMILGKVVLGIRANLAHVFFVALLLYLFWIVKKAKKRAFWTAVLLHAFFLLNGLFLYLKKIPLFEIQGKKSSYLLLNIESVALLTMGLNALLIIYYIYIREYFVDNC